MSRGFQATVDAVVLDTGRFWNRALMVAGIVLAGWVIWFVAGSMAVLRTSERARVEALLAPHVVQAGISGRVLRVNLSLGQKVRAGDVLVVLDAEAETLRLAEQRARRDSVAGQVVAIETELASEKRGGAVAQQNADAERVTAKYREESAAHVAEVKVEQARRYKALEEKAAVAPMENMERQAEAMRAVGESNVSRAEAVRVGAAAAMGRAEREIRVDRLQRELVTLRGELATHDALINTLGHDVAIRSIRAPIDGILADVAQITPGQVVDKTERLATVVPSAQYRVVANFAAKDVGSLTRGQTARLRFDAYPWPRYAPSVARVHEVASEAVGGLVRVELDIVDAKVPLQHGLTGTVEVEVARRHPYEVALGMVEDWSRDPASPPAP